MRNFLFFLMLLFCLQGTAQGNPDSLWGIWQNEKASDTARIKSLTKYVWSGLLFMRPDSALVLTKQQETFATEVGLEDEMCEIYNTQAACYAVMGDIGQSMALFRKFNNCSELISDYGGMAAANTNIGRQYHAIGMIDSALYHLKLGVKFHFKVNNKSGAAIAYENLGHVKYDQGDLNKSLEYYYNSLRLRESLQDSSGISNSYVSIANSNADLGNHQEALEYLKKSLSYSIPINKLNSISSAYGNMGSVYMELGHIDSARYYHEKCLNIRLMMGDPRAISNSYVNLGNVFREEGVLDSAITYFNKALDLSEQIGDLKGSSFAQRNIALTYYELGDLKSSESFALKAYQTAVQIQNVIGQQTISQLLKNIYADKGRYKDAYFYLETYVELTDSIESEENEKQLFRQEFKYKYELEAAADSIDFAKEVEITDIKIKKQEAEISAKRNQQIALFGGLMIVLIFAFFIYNRFKVTRSQKYIIEEAHAKLEEKNQEILDSITYAKRIQGAILPQISKIKEELPDSFVLYQPKDIVAGDFYWMEKSGGFTYIAAADCTGHGVPGAMVSVICNNGLNRSVREYGIQEPGKILDKTRELVITEFEKSEEDVKDGMDIALCAIKRREKSIEVQYAGAHNPLWVIQKGKEEIVEYKADKQPIGKFEAPIPYSTHTINLNEGDSFYLFSDGFADQFGGEKGKKFKSKNFKKLLISIKDLPMDEQQEKIQASFNSWKGSIEQLDDICVIGVRL